MLRVGHKEVFCADTESIITLKNIETEQKVGSRFSERKIISKDGTRSSEEEWERKKKLKVRE